jgi:predicted MFS family arabinose efflux permease
MNSVAKLVTGQAPPAASERHAVRAAPGLVPGRHGSLALMLALGVVSMMDATLVQALLTPVKTALHLTDENFGRLAAAFMVPSMVAVPLFGLLATRFPRKHLLVGAAIVWSLASAGGALAGGLATLMLWRGLTGFGEAAYQGLVPGWLADLYGRSSRNFVFSLFMLRNKLGSALALALGGWLAARYGWRAAFLVTGLPGVALALGLLLLREPAPGAADGVVAARSSLPLRVQVAVFRIAPYTTHLAGLVFFYSGTVTAQFWLPAFLHRVYGLTNQAATGFVAEVLLAIAPAGLIGGYLVGRYLSGSRGGMQAALSVTSFLAAALFALAFATRELAVAKTMAVLAIIAFGSTAGTLTNLLVETVPPALRSVAGSIGAFIAIGVSGAVAPWVLGALSDRYGLPDAIFLGPATYAVAGVIWAAAAWAARDQPHRISSRSGE